MSAATRSTLFHKDIPLIEENLDSGLKDFLKSYKSPHTPGGTDRDGLYQRYMIDLGHPLPEFDHSLAKAYRATDQSAASRSLYAMVLANHLPYRIKAIEDLQQMQHPNLTSLVASGVCHISILDEFRQVLFLERPIGPSLSEIRKTQPRLHEHLVIDHILQPLSKVLIALSEKEVVHSAIHPDRIYLKKELILGECVSAPGGYLQQYLYEPIERMMTDPTSKGTGNEKTDVYAVGILAYELFYGLQRFKTMPREEFISNALAIGTYNVLMQNLEISESFQDFFRGILNDDPEERWNLSQLSSWAGGKRYNMIAPTTPREAVRPIRFNQEDFFSRRALAYALHRQWRMAIKDLSSLKIDRWCEMSMHRPDLGEKISRILRLGREAGKESQNNDAVTRLISILDPIGPIRTPSFSLLVEGIGLKLADLMHQDKAKETREVVDVILNDLPTYWSVQAQEQPSPQVSRQVWLLQRARNFIKMKTLGFGIERALYDLNPSLPCQSELVRKYHITNLPDLMRTLDALASSLGGHQSLVDRHLLGFIGSKLEMTRELKLEELSNIPELSSNPEPMALRLLAKAQQKSGKISLTGLTCWVGIRIESILNAVHNRIVRKQLLMQLKRIAVEGSINELMTILMNREMVIKDQQGFSLAISLFSINKKRIENLQEDSVIDVYSESLGGLISITLGYGILGVAGYFTLSSALGW
jgi:serine/threonine protein kinase